VFHSSMYSQGLFDAPYTILQLACHNRRYFARKTFHKKNFIYTTKNSRRSGSFEVNPVKKLNILPQTVQRSQRQDYRFCR
jgi:hypothetical protein